jgi:hypothetical protein
LDARVEIDDNASSNDCVTFWLEQGGAQAQGSFDGYCHGFTRSAVDVWLPTSELQPGNFDLVATSYRDNGVPIVLRQTILKPDESAWAGNTLGLGIDVPPPWTPLSTTSQNGGVAVNSVGRTYVFDTNGLVSQISSAGKNMLQRPMVLEATFPWFGSYSPPFPNSVSWSYGIPTYTYISQGSPSGSVRITQQANGSAAGASIQVTSVVTIDYDGLAWWDMTLTGDVSKLSSFSIALPMDPSVPMYWHRMNHPGDGGGALTYTGSAPQPYQQYSDTNPPISATFSPFTWLGDNDRGLFWFSESAANWPNRYNAAVGQRPVEVASESGAYVERFNIVQNGNTFPSEHIFSFGMQATPTKATVSHRTVSLQAPVGAPTSDEASSGVLLYPTYAAFNGACSSSIPWTPMDFGWFQPTSSSAMYSEFACVHNQTLAPQKNLVLTYSLLTELSWTPDPQQLGLGTSLVWGWHSADWLVEPGQGEGAWSVASGQYAYALLHAVDPSSLEYQQYATYGSGTLMQTDPNSSALGADGFYHDQTTIYFREYARQSDQLDPPYFIRYPVLPIRDYRNLYARTYFLRKQMKPNGFSVAHGSSILDAPVLAYDDGFFNGEQFRPLIESAIDSCDMTINYYSMMTSALGAPLMDVFRAEFMGRQWGVTPYFLAYDFTDQHVCAPGCGLCQNLGNEAVSLALLHDVGLYQVFLDGNGLTPVATAYGQIAHFASQWGFNYLNAQFLPYFASPPAVTSSAAGTYASLYVGGDGNVAMVVLVNTNGSDQTTDVTFNGYYPASLYDANDQQIFPPPMAPPNTYTVTVPANGYKLIAALNMGH